MIRSPSIYRQAVACAALIRITSFNRFSRRRVYLALEKNGSCETKSIKSRAVAFFNSCGCANRRAYSRLMFSFMNTCFDHQSGSLLTADTLIMGSFLDSSVGLRNFKSSHIHMRKVLLQLIEDIQYVHQSFYISGKCHDLCRYPDHDPVLVVHEACVMLAVLLLHLQRMDLEFIELFYFYMCFLLNIFQRELSIAQPKRCTILLVPYIHWIDSQLPNTFLDVSQAFSGIIPTAGTIAFQFYSLFTLYVNKLTIYISIKLTLITEGNRHETCFLPPMSSLTTLVALTWILTLGHPKTPRLSKCLHLV